MPFPEGRNPSVLFFFQNRRKKRTLVTPVTPSPGPLFSSTNWVTPFFLFSLEEETIWGPV